MTTVLAYAWNHEGLGHVTRLLAVLDEILEIDPTTETFVLAEEESPLLFEGQHPYMALPSLQASYKAGVLHERHEVLSRGLRLREAGGIALAGLLLETVRPSVVVHDSVLWPPLFDGARDAGIAQCLIVRKRWDLTDYLERMREDLRNVGLLLFPHDADELALQVGSIPAVVRVECVGPLVRAPTRMPKSQQDRLLPREEASRPLTVLLTCGGAGYGEIQEFVDAATKALLALTGSEDVNVIINSGWFFDGSYQLPITDRVRWTVVRHVRGLSDLFEQVDLVVSQTGYNSAWECVRAGTPTVLVVGSRPFDDQSERAARMAGLQSSLVNCDTLQVDKLSAACKRALAEGRNAVRVGVDLDRGRHEAAQAILALASLGGTQPGKATS